MTNNPLRILQTLDGHLRSPFDLNIFGRSALALGFPDSPARFKATMDVDAILPARDIQALEQNDVMRVDPEDREDIRFLLEQKDFQHSGLGAAFDRAAVPRVAEIEEAFTRNRTWIDNLDSE